MGCISRIEVVSMLNLLTGHWQVPWTPQVKFKASNNRVFRWALGLQPYSLVVQHVTLKDNILANVLSHQGAYLIVSV